MPDLLDAGLPSPAAGAFTGRAGGVSAPPWASLDLALHVEDDPGAVATNRARLLAATTGAGSLAFVEQVHGAGVAVVATGGGCAPGADALVTTTPGVALVVLAADCLPVLLADADGGVVAAAHAGRQGLTSGVLQQTLHVMADCGADPARTTAVLGPSVCGACYEVPEELADEVEAAVPGSRSTTRQGTASVDLSAGAEGLLRAAGVTQVRRLGGCTLEQPDRFFSFRRDGRTGRHAGLVWLRP